MKKNLIVTNTILVMLLIFMQAVGFSQITKEQLSSMTPKDALQNLVDGNNRFINLQMKDRDWSTKIEVTSTGQYPQAVILSCMDSRVPAEIIFDQGLGDIFNIRIAGNIVNTDILGSMEYGCGVVGSKVILVLGHTECGAVKGAIDNVELGNLTGLLDKIEPAVAATVFAGSRTSKDGSFVELVTEENIRQAMNNIRLNSPLLKSMEDEGKIDIVGGLYDVSTGKVTIYQ